MLVVDSDDPARPRDRPRAWRSGRPATDRTARTYRRPLLDVGPRSADDCIAEQPERTE
ncbi:hypothetical protein [Streptomyces canus]|uniref:hypothetical protein n=1 Tax=Streptomyces canus TaxID=58343 RepID=UPI0022509920|nr:hypothetical protein [Streptomyces canus]MCX4852784.1 hypothetical protein [Streptomyces canus]